MKQIECTVCSGKNVEIAWNKVGSVYSKEMYELAHCKDCNHYFTYPQPKQGDLNKIYNDNYAYQAHQLIRSEKIAHARSQAKYVAGLTKKGSVLEIGCMHGFLLKELNKLGLKASGIELDPEAVKICQKEGLNVKQMSFEDFLVKDKNKYDVIIMIHVLEHILNPNANLALLKNHLTDKGKLITVVPNSMSKTRKMFGKFWGYWQVPVHVNHFNDQSVRKLLSNEGFKVKRIDYFGADSLFFLSTLANVAKSKNTEKSLSLPKKILVKASSFVLGNWIKVGNEDMVVVSETASK